MEAAAARTLLLNQGYEALKVITWQRALTLLFLGKVEVVAEYDRRIRSMSLVLRTPAVVRLVRGIRRHFRPVAFTRAHLYARDGFRCQYCGDRTPEDDLTYDHVVPKAQGGITCWTNIVTCCVGCNHRKGGRTPREAGMRLLSRPAQPTWLPAVAIRLSLRVVPEPWRDYLAA